LTDAEPGAAEPGAAGAGAAEPGGAEEPTGPFQEAVLEVIGAVRAALDLVEDLVRHPPEAASGSGLAELASGLATELVRTVQPWLGGAAPEPAPGGADGDEHPA
jgi:hypothetical protein